MRYGCLLAMLPCLWPALAAADAYAPLEQRRFVHEGVQREYFVHVPANVPGPLPVVLAIHGYGSTATGFAAFHDLRQHADENGYIVVYPQGTHFVDSGATRPYRVTSWNMLGSATPDPGAGPQCLEDAYVYPHPPDCADPGQCTWASCGDDLGYFSKLMDALAAEFNTDTNRYYLLGMSNGGMMALRLACDLPARFAAIAAIAAQLPRGYNCGPGSDLPMLHLSGAKDDTVPANGRAASDGFVYVSVTALARRWADALQCTSEIKNWSSTASDAARLVCRAHSHCRVPGHEVVTCQDPNESHNWPARRPGGAWPTCVTEQQAENMPEQRLCEARTEYGPHRGMDVIWQFFRRYSRR